MPLCSDYHYYKGYCVMGARCPHEHSRDFAIADDAEEAKAWLKVSVDKRPYVPEKTDGSAVKAVKEARDKEIGPEERAKEVKEEREWVLQFERERIKKAAEKRALAKSAAKPAAATATGAEPPQKKAKTVNETTSPNPTVKNSGNSKPAQAAPKVAPRTAAAAPKPGPKKNRPIIPFNVKSGVPRLLRQNMLNKILDEYERIYPNALDKALQEGVKLEAALEASAEGQSTYKNLIAHNLKQLRAIDPID